MSRAGLIAKAELALMVRSRVALIGVISLLLLSTIAAATSHTHMAQERLSRVTNQTQTDELFEAQPARHPHRMVHYGSYVYRPIGILAGFDPGIDPFSGTTLYLEGHRQNSATISAVRENSSLMRFGQLTPAFVLQTLAPLLLVFVGFGVITRERTRGSLRLLLSSGVTALDLIIGKILALTSVGLVALAPAWVALTLMAMAKPEESLAAALIGLSYGLYVLIWIVGIVAVSALARTGQAALLILTGIWCFVAIVAPRGATEVAIRLEPLQSRSATDLIIQEELRQLGDSHNPDDPFFAAFKARTLAQYGVSRVEDLPFNFRGAVSAEGEALTSRLFDKYFTELAASQRTQSQIVSGLSILSPAIAVRRVSMAGAGTDLETHLRFLQQSEAHRFAMVQYLNGLHRNRLSLADDAARSKDRQAEQRTRIGADNWAKAPDFVFKPTSATERFHAAIAPILTLLLWLATLTLLVGWSGRSLERRAL
jgi:ABC-2 type transport system permease protein